MYLMGYQEYYIMGWVKIQLPSGSKFNYNTHADYLFHNFNLIKVEKGRLPVYYGIGASVVLASSVGAGIRVPVGLEYIFANAPFDIFLEVVPMLAVVPSTSFGVNAGLGARYFFK
jgi:hypothetical protein